MSAENNAICYIRPHHAARLRLICFSYAGGSASVYRPYDKLVHPDAEIISVQLPGRGTQFSDPPIKDWPSMKSFIYQVLSEVCTKPYILFGHSFGTRLAFESALHQTRQDNPPCHMICSGARALHLRNHADPIHELPDEDFVEKLGQMGGTPQAIIENRGLMNLLIPMLRADFGLSYAHTVNQNTRFNFPATILYGTRDERTPLEAVYAWQKYFCSPIDVKRVEGGHFYIHSNPNSVAGHINCIVSAILLNKGCIG